jgi:NDP-sugar pyrophosphorylase family protein
MPEYPTLPVAILAGGLGTRLYPVTETLPKSLVEVNGEPFLAHQLRLLRRSGIRRAVLCVAHMGEMIRDFAGDGRQFGLSIEYSFDGPELLGTAGALKKSLPLLGPAFFVLYGDSYLPCSYADIERSFEASGKPALMTVFRNENRWDSSNVEFAHGRILAYDKGRRTSGMRYIDYGVGIFVRSVFEQIGPCYDLAQLYKDLIDQSQLAGHKVQQRFYHVGSFDGIRELAGLLAQARPKN